jgi:hypothetical protein
MNINGWYCYWNILTEKRNYINKLFYNKLLNQGIFLSGTDDGYLLLL